jgi:hypothetical protein
MRASANLMLILIFTGLLGAAAASAGAAAEFGVLGGLAAAPIGGSLAAFAAALVLARRNSAAVPHAPALPLMSADEQVRALRQIAARGREATAEKPAAPSRAA